MPSNLLSLMSQGGLVMDGAMGTMLLASGVDPAVCLEHLNLTEPERVLEVHRGYVEAGARVLLTNTFQAQPEHLRRFGLASDMEAIVRAGVDLARTAAEGRAFVLGALGPADIAADDLPRLVKAFAAADGLLIETAADPALVDRVDAAAPLLLSATFLRRGQDLVTASGLDARELARQARRRPLAALGVNCGREIGMAEIRRILEDYRRETDLPLFARPNAGTPTRDDAGWRYPLDAGAMALAARTLSPLAMIGGCCGTTPAHIAALAHASRRFAGC